MKPKPTMKWVTTTIKNIQHCYMCGGQGWVHRFFGFGKAICCPACKGTRVIEQIDHRQYLAEVEPELHHGAGIWTTNEF